MGIKTKFNPMGGMTGDKGKLSDWRYETLANGQIVLYEYLGTYNSIKPVYVPMKKGKAVINDYASDGTTTTTSNTPFYNNFNVISADLQNVPFVHNSMFKAFYNCQNLTFINNINPNVTNMSNTFYYCNNLNQNIQIPNSVTDMAYTFSGCSNLNQNIQIPNSVTDMAYTFSGCSNLNQNIQIPSSVTSTSYTFYNCRNLNQNIQIPNGVTRMYGTFHNCINLNQNIQIPNSVTLMSYTFRNCTNLNQNIQIPNSVTLMADTFWHCTNLQGNITILSEKITATNNCFNGSGLTKNVIFSSRYINNTYTPTRNSLATAATGGYAVGTAAGNSVNNTAQNAVFYAYDPVSWEGYNAWVGDGANWRLTKWGGIGKAAGQTSIKVPTSITSYSTFPTVLSNSCFQGVSGLEEIDCQHVPIYPLASSGDNRFFGNMVGVKSVYNFNCKDSTQLYALVFNSQDLNSFSTGTPQMGTFFIDMPPAITNAQAMPEKTKDFCNYYLLSDSMGSGLRTLRMYGTFRNTNAKPYNMYFTHTTWSNGANWADGWNSSHRKTAYFYFTYANGTATNIYNTFNVASWRGSSGGGLDKDPMYNSTRNTYAYNMSKHFCPTNNASWWCSPVNGALQYTGVGYSDGTPITFPTSLSVRQYPDKYVTVSTNTQDISNMFNGFFKINTPITIPDGVTNMSYTFHDCYNLNQNIQVPSGVTDVWGTFCNCTNLNQNIQIPSSVTGMYVTFSNCTNLNQNIQIPNSVISMWSTFSDCSNLNQNIQIPSSVTSMTYTFRDCTNLNGDITILSNQVADADRCFYGTTKAKNVYIPFKYSNGVNSKTFNSFVSARYLYANGVSRNQDGVTVYDLNT